MTPVDQDQNPPTTTKTPTKTMVYQKPQLLTKEERVFWWARVFLKATDPQRFLAVHFSQDLNHFSVGSKSSSPTKQHLMLLQHKNIA